MIGLKRGTVRLAPHYPKWVEIFEREKRRILQGTGSLIVDIEHTGSTSVPGLRAKPIIDMTAGVRRLKDVNDLIKPLAEIGYGFYRKFGRQTLFAKGPDSKRTHYLHVMKYRGAKYKRDLLFRDFLRNHPEKAKLYAGLKKELAKKYPSDREKYTIGKKLFIEETIRLAKRS